MSIYDKGQEIEQILVKKDEEVSKVKLYARDFFADYKVKVFFTTYRVIEEKNLEDKEKEDPIFQAEEIMIYTDYTKYKQQMMKRIKGYYTSYLKYEVLD